MSQQPSRSRSKIEDILPLSPLQEGFVFLGLLHTEGPDLYVGQVAFDLEGPFDGARMRAAAEALLRRARQPAGRVPAAQERGLGPTRPARRRPAVAGRRPERAARGRARPRGRPARRRRPRPPLRPRPPAAAALHGDPALRAATSGW
ncbi:hypothetical protein R2F25_07100 [Streptomyces sp. UP1A-1]|nr:hypothetical protein [Streptomyces sp. UP1A-1]